jgi:hypothetical protein
MNSERFPKIRLRCDGESHRAVDRAELRALNRFCAERLLSRCQVARRTFKAHLLERSHRPRGVNRPQVPVCCNGHLGTLSRWRIRSRSPKRLRGLRRSGAGKTIHKAADQVRLEKFVHETCRFESDLAHLVEQGFSGEPETLIKFTLI